MLALGQRLRASASAVHLGGLRAAVEHSRTFVGQPGSGVHSRARREARGRKRHSGHLETGGVGRKKVRGRTAFLESQSDQ